LEGLLHPGNCGKVRRLLGDVMRNAIVSSASNTSGGESGRIGIVMIRVELPQHLRTLAHVGREVEVEVEGPVTQRSVLDALEARYPMLRGTIRDHGTLQRRAFLRFFACEEDLSHESPDAPLPEAVVSGKEPFLIVGAIAGG
jgi:sulfur-carrier protein